MSARSALPGPRLLPYGPGRFQFGELRLPGENERPRRAPCPVVVVIHGGFWRARYGLDHIIPLCQAINALKIATWSLEYRRLGNPGGGWPGTFEDIARGLDALRELAPGHGLDLSQVAVLGHSAGGQLAMWAAARHSLPPGSPLYSPDPLPLRAAVSLAGVTDLRRAWELGLSGCVVAELLGGSPEQVPERYAAASPIQRLPLGLPQFLLHGSQDDTVPFELSQAYIGAAEALNDPARLLPLDGLGHFELIDPLSTAWPILSGVLTKIFPNG